MTSIKHSYRVGDLVWFDSIPYYVSSIDRSKWSRGVELMFDRSVITCIPHPLYDDESPRVIRWDNLKGARLS